jgi:hypothetical protein
MMHDHSTDFHYLASRDEYCAWMKSRHQCYAD